VPVTPIILKAISTLTALPCGAGKGLAEVNGTSKRAIEGKLERQARYALWNWTGSIRLHVANWPAAMTGDPKTTPVVLRIIDKRATLLGLDKFAQEPEQARTLVSAGSPEEYVAGLQRAIAMVEGEDAVSRYR
jgi:hypothetical protein